MTYISSGARHSSEALYSKARDIMQLSRHISDYILPDIAVLNDHGHEDKSVYFTGDIIRYSNSLIPNIVKAENEFFQDARSQYVSAITNLTERLYKNCERLENANSNGKEFVRILRKEIHKFKKLQRVWKLTL